MLFDHERLDVYRCALAALELCDAIVARLPPGRAHLKDQLDRASTSVLLNVAEGAGEFSAAEKRRFYRMARRSATEAAAVLHLVEMREPAVRAQATEARTLLARVVAMLVRMTKTAKPDPKT